METKTKQRKEIEKKNIAAILNKRAELFLDFEPHNKEVKTQHFPIWKLFSSNLGVRPLSSFAKTYQRIQTQIKHEQQVQTRQECGLTRGEEGQKGFDSEVGGFPLTVLMKSNTIANGPMLKILSYR